MYLTLRKLQDALDCVDSCISHLLGVCVEGDGDIQQQLPVFDPTDKVLDPDFQVSSCLVDLLGVTLSSLCQLLSCLQQLVRIGICVLKATLHITEIIHTCIALY